MFDIQATIRWVTSVLMDPNGTAPQYREAEKTWQQSLIELVLPVYVAAFLVSIIITWVTGGFSMPFGLALLSMVWAIGWTFVVALIFDYLAGTFDGERNFDAAYAVVALAIIPSAVGTAIAPLPWLGWLISLVASIYSLVLAYRFLPQFLQIPESSRVKHFVLSIVIAIIVNLLVSMTLAAMLLPSVVGGVALSQPSGQSAPSGMFGGFERQAEFVDAATQDTYEPPSDGEITTNQMQRFVDVLRKTNELRERLGKSMESMEDKEPSLTDVFSGVNDAVRLTTAEMEVVKTADWNWAEHLWVKGQIQTARIQQDLNATTQHNYDLFLEFQEEIEQFE